MPSPFAQSLLLALVAGRLVAAEPVIRLDPAIAAGSVDSANQYQTDLRVHPTDPRKLAITAKRGSNETETLILVSQDGGATWSSTGLSQSSDPDCVFLGNGRLLRSFIDQANGNKIGIQRSPDDGLSWDAKLNAPPAVDHAQIIGDRSASAYAGSLYVAGRPFSGGGIQVARSRNGGATWESSFVPLNTQFGMGFVRSVQTYRDGTVLVGMSSKGNIKSAGGVYAGNIKYYGALRSVDGGVTFAPLVQVAVADTTVPLGVGGGRDCMLAVGRRGSGERAYLIYSLPQPAPAGARLMLSTSDDQGQTWTAARAVITPPADRGVGNSCVTVNRFGTVGLQYYLMTASGQFDIYFAASTDGGLTFSTPTRITPLTCGEPTAVQPREPGGDQVWGDTASDGAFHLVWPDARTGARYITYTQRLVVDPVNPAITSPPVLGAAVGQPYTYAMVGSGMPLPRYTLLAGPAGMTIDPISGVVQWTPTAVGTYTVSIQAGNGGTQTTTQTYNLTVAATNVAPVAVAAIPAQSGTVGTAFAYTIPAGTFSDANGDTLTWSATGLPAGLAFTAGTRTIAGTPTATGAATATVTVGDGHGHSASSVLLITIAAFSGTPATGAGGDGGGGGCGMGASLAILGLALAWRPRLASAGAHRAGR